MMFNSKEEILVWLEQFIVTIEGKYTISNKLLRESNNNNTEEYKELFDSIPQFKTANGYFKCSYTDFNKKLNKVIKEYNLNKGIVSKCVKRYAEKAEAERNPYNPLLSYYIHKEGVGSRLATDVLSFNDDEEVLKTNWKKA